MVKTKTNYSKTSFADENNNSKIRWILPTIFFVWTVCFGRFLRPGRSFLARFWLGHLSRRDIYHYGNFSTRRKCGQGKGPKQARSPCVRSPALRLEEENLAHSSSAVTPDATQWSRWMAVIYCFNMLYCHEKSDFVEAAGLVRFFIWRALHEATGSTSYVCIYATNIFHFPKTTFFLKFFSCWFFRPISGFTYNNWLR